MVEDYAYAGMDFTVDLDLPLPPGRQWGDMGTEKQETLKWMKMFLCFFLNVLYFLCQVTRPIYSHADVGVAQPRGASPLDMRVGSCFVPLGDDITGDLKENLERLTLDILDADIDDLPMRYQRSTTGVLGRFSRLLHRVARAVMCYHEHH